jgi:hypothetical protein
MAILMHEPEVVLGFGIPEFGGSAVPMRRHCVVLRHAFATTIHVAKPHLSIRISLLCKRTK